MEVDLGSAMRLLVSALRAAMPSRFSTSDSTLARQQVGIKVGIVAQYANKEVLTCLKDCLKSSIVRGLGPQAPKSPFQTASEIYDIAVLADS